MEFQLDGLLVDRARRTRRQLDKAARWGRAPRWNVGVVAASVRKATFRDSDGNEIGFGGAPA